MPSNIPTMRSLMEDPLYRAYMKHVPPAHHANRTGEPWRLWVRAEDGRWLTRTYDTYRAVWPVFTGRLRMPGQDPTITSKRVFYAPPGEWYRVKIRRNPTLHDPSVWKLEWRWRQTFHWDGVDLHWCGRCRRPVYWMPLFHNHHALRLQPTVSMDDNFRCLVCGIRWIATPAIDQMTRIERIPS